MIGFVLLLSLLTGSLVQACSDMGSRSEQKPTVGAIKHDELAKVVTDDKAKPPAKKEKKATKVSEAAKQTPVTSTIFAKKTLSTMNFEELKKSKEELAKSGNKKTAIKYLERMVPICSDLNELKTIMLELAQLLYETEDYTKASKMYHEFTLLYPGSDEVEYAMYQAITSTFKLTLDAEHDQTKTVEAKELAQAFLDRSSFATYKKDVEAIAVQCEERLLESETNIFNFYMKRGNYVAAKTRLSTIKQAYVGKLIPDVGMRIANLENDYVNATKLLHLDQPTTVATQEKTEDPIKIFC